MSEYTEYLGMVAAFCTTVAFLPQAIQTIKTRHTDDISLSMYIILNVGLTLWLIYGIQLDMLPIILANCCTLVLSTIILAIKVRNEWKG
jgi:MtN3 and saliva related transmembrane protein